MLSYTRHPSPLGELLLVADSCALRWLCLPAQRFLPDLSQVCRRDDLPVFQPFRTWIDRYFAGEKPSVAVLPLSPSGSAYRQEVWQMLLDIPYGETVSYGELARQYAVRHGLRPCAQAIGGAVGHNPLSLLIPCHRVIGARHTWGGYGGGLSAKQFLLRLEKNASLQGTPLL